MSPEFLSSLAGILISLLASYLPGFSAWFDNQSPNYKRLFMLIALLFSTGAVFGLSCQSWLNLVPYDVMTCTQEGLTLAIRSFGLAVIANQAAYTISPETKAAAQRKALRQVAALRSASLPAQKRIKAQ